MNEHLTGIFNSIKRESVRISELQDLAQKIYGVYHLDKSLLWLTEEVGELVRSIRKDHTREMVAAELGDVLAWILNLSNILGLDLDDVIANAFEKERSRQVEKYGELKYWPVGAL